MKFFYPPEFNTLVNGHWVLIDNCLLDRLYCYRESDYLKQFLKNTEGSDLLIEEHVRFEFLRSCGEPKIYEDKMLFLNVPSFQSLPTTHPEISAKIREQALTLSQIYSMKKLTGCSPSYVDLILSSVSAYYKHDIYIVTENKKDFPSCVFDLVTLFHCETSDSAFGTYFILNFNKNAFEELVGDLQDKRLKYESLNV